MFVDRNYDMKEESYDYIFKDPSSSGRLYSDAKSALIDDISVEDKIWKKEECSFLIKRQTERTYEEVADFSIEKSDNYSYTEPTIDGFEEAESRVVKQAEEDECSSCKGDGFYCDECGDTGEKSCSCYTGYKSSKCPNCGGSGKVEVLSSDLEDKNIQCGDCDGSGRKKTSHSRCNGTGSIKCKNCLGGSKDVECSNCKGLGKTLKIEATRVEYQVDVNTNDHTPPDLSSADGYRIKNPKDSYWKTTEAETFNSLEEAEENGENPTASLLMPVPSGEKIKIGYTSKEIKYKKVNVVLKTSSLKGDQSDDTVEHTIWVNEDNSVYSGRINAERIGLATSALVFAVKYAVFGLWAGTIGSLILYLPFAFVDDYIIAIPDPVLVAVFSLIWLVVNALIAWTSLMEARYSFSV